MTTPGESTRITTERALSTKGGILERPRFTTRPEKRLSVEGVRNDIEGNKNRNENSKPTGYQRHYLYPKAFTDENV